MEERWAPEVDALCFAALARWVRDEDKPTRAIFASRYAPGDRRTFRAADGTRLGEVRRDDPDPAWAVTDSAALAEHLKQFPECVETVTEIDGTEAQVIAALAECAPHLLAEVTRVTPGAVEDALRQSRKGGFSAAPGIELVAPLGALKVVADKAAVVRVGRLVQSALPALDAAPEEMS